MSLVGYYLARPVNMFLGPPHNHEGHHCQSTEYPIEEAKKVNE